MKISTEFRGLQTYGMKISGESSSKQRLKELPTYSHVPDHDFVGIGKNIKELVSHLTDPTSGVVSICGMGGLGKTTLAKVVYHRNEVKNHFNCFAWVYVSQQYQARDIWEGILFNLVSDKERKEIKEMSNDEVVTKLYQELEEKKCLVALDDVWTIDVWDILKAAFPENTKILITTREKDVAEHANQERRGFVCEPQTLTDEESWEFLKKKASYLQSIEAMRSTAGDDILKLNGIGTHRDS